MTARKHPASGRLSVALMLVGLLLTILAASYALIAARDMPLPAPTATAGLSAEDLRVLEARRLGYTMALLLVAVLLVLAFVVGAYLLIRVGRAVVQTPLGGKPTAYVDAWARYRVTDEQIEAATNEDVEPKPPLDRSDSSGDDADGDGGPTGPQRPTA